MSANFNSIPSPDEIKQQLTEAARELDQYFKGKADIDPKAELGKMKEFASLLNLLTFYIFQQSINDANSLSILQEVTEILKTATNSLQGRNILSNPAGSEHISSSYNWYEELLILLIRIDRANSIGASEDFLLPIDGEGSADGGGTSHAIQALIKTFRDKLDGCIPGVCGI